MTDGQAAKVGMGNEHRVQTWRRRGWHILYQLECANRQHAYALEQELLHWIRDAGYGRYYPSGDGYTETFTADIAESVRVRMREYIDPVAMAARQAQLDARWESQRRAAYVRNWVRVAALAAIAVMVLVALTR